MSEIDTPVGGLVEGVSSASHDGVSASPEVDTLRLRSFVGLVLGLVGPRANLAVSGILLTLLVSHRTGANALAVAFALSSNQLIGWIAYPVFGRASDRTRSAVGRRAPYMAAGLFVMGACTFAYTLVGGYWPIVGLIGLVRLASVVGGLTNIAVIPEVFGKSRTLKAAALIGLLGTGLGLIIKVTVIATWKQSVPSTWNLPFRMAGIVMMAVGVAVLLLVREVPAARKMADRDRSITEVVARRAPRPSFESEREGAPGRRVPVLGGRHGDGKPDHRLLPEDPARRGGHPDDPRVGDRNSSALDRASGRIPDQQIAQAQAGRHIDAGARWGARRAPVLRARHMAIGGARFRERSVAGGVRDLARTDAPAAAAAVRRVRGASRQIRRPVQPGGNRFLAPCRPGGERDRQLQDDLAVPCGGRHPRGVDHVPPLGARRPEPGADGRSRQPLRRLGLRADHPARSEAVRGRGDDRGCRRCLAVREREESPR